MFLRKKTAKSWTWVMENSKTTKGTKLRQITLDELEQLTDLYLWGNVGANNFAKLRRGSWWRAGQSSKT
jgi:hypothetical protein